MTAAAPIRCPPPAGMEQWQICQERLAAWRVQHPISDVAAMPGYDQTARWLASYVRQGRLLEIGCKTGGLRKSCCFPPGIEYHGLDPLRVEGADYDFPFYGVMAEEMAFPDGHFQAVLIKDSFDYLPDPARVLRSIARMLAPSGWLLICEGDHPSCLDRVAAELRHGLAQALNPLLAQSERWRGLAQRGGIVLRPARDFADTYPQGDYSRRQIAQLVGQAGFILVETVVRRARLYLAGRTPTPCL